VQPGQYKSFGELNKHVVKPAVAEVNALAAFGILVVPVKQGKKVKDVMVGWWRKNAESLTESWQELQRTKVGRRARVAGLAERVVDPKPSLERYERKARKALPKTGS